MGVGEDLEEESGVSGLDGVVLGERLEGGRSS